jgi:thymidylate kinase
MTFESRKLAKILEWLDFRNISYILVGEELQHLVSEVSSDVDLVISQEKIDGVQSLVGEICEACGVRCVQLLQHEQLAFYFVLSWLDQNHWHYLRLDICSDYLRNARLLLTADEMLADRRKDVDSGFYVPASEKNLLYYLLKKIDKGAVNETQFEYLRKNLVACQSDILPELCRFWSREQSQNLFQCLGKGDLAQFEKMVPVLQTSLRKRCRLSLKNTLAEACRMIRRIMCPTGVWITILGPDGCGKSSVIEALLPRIEPAFRRTRLMHFRPKVGCRGPADNSNSANPHDQPDRSAIGSLLKLGYYAADYITGYFLKVWPARIRSTFLVFDRYYDDLLVDQKRYCYSGPSWLLRWIRPFIPKPDLVFCLDAPAEVLQSRKQEVPFEVTARQREAYQKMVSRLRNGHVIDASQPLEKVVLDVESMVLEFMEKRMAKRMR